MGIAIAFAIGIVWVYYIYLDIRKRDLADFEQVSNDSLINTDNLISPTTADTVAIGETGTGAKITGPVSTCSGNECCGDSTTWSDTDNKCVFKTVQSFTTQKNLSVISSSHTRLLPNSLRKLKPAYPSST
jgi:hypothetical protein